VTIAGWLDARRPVPPPALRARIDGALGESVRADEGDVVEACLRAGERLVESLLRNNATTRESALDLLAADALVTYAFEAASTHPAALRVHAREAMLRIALLSVSAHEESGAR
jgi:hypothetical protein